MTFTDIEKLDIRLALLAASKGAMNKLESDVGLTHRERKLLADYAISWIDLAERLL